MINFLVYKIHRKPFSDFCTLHMDHASCNGSASKVDGIRWEQMLKLMICVNYKMKNQGDLSCWQNLKFTNNAMEIAILIFIPIFNPENKLIEIWYFLSILSF